MKRIDSVKIIEESDGLQGVNYCGYLGELVDNRAQPFTFSLPIRFYRSRHLVTTGKYFAADNVDNEKQAIENYKRFIGYLEGDWEFIYIQAQAIVSISDDGENCGQKEVTSMGLYGIESDSDEEYLQSIREEQLSDLAGQLSDMGFTDTEIMEAIK